MEGEGKRGRFSNGKGKKAKLNPVRVQEYDFFITPDGSEEKTSSVKRRPASKKSAAEIKARRSSSRSDTVDSAFSVVTSAGRFVQVKE